MKRAAGLALALAAFWMAPAHAATCQDRANIRQQDRYAPFAVGDSVMLAAAEELAEHGFAVDAQACRMYNQGLEVMGSRQLPDVLVVALGSNASVSAAQVRSTLEMVGPFSRVVFVLPRALGGGPDADGRVFRAAETAYPDQVTTLDWPGYSEPHGEWLAPDGLHLTSAGAQAFADFIAEAVQFAPVDPVELPPLKEPRRRKPEPPRPEGDPRVAAMWRAAGQTVAWLVRPALSLLAPLLANSDSEPQDL